MCSADIWKVFSHCPYMKMWQFSTNQGQRTALISCLDYGKGYVQRTYTPYLLKCGVLRRLFDSGLPQPSCR